jgi:hypothetical protein
MEVLQVSPAGRHLTRFSALCLAALALSACEVDPRKQPPRFRLEGSLGQVMDTGYDEARVLLSATDVALLFVRVRPLGADPSPDASVDPMMMTGVSEDYPVKVGYRLLDDPVGGRVDLAALDMNGAQRGVISRLVYNDPRNTLPVILRGTMFFDRPLDPNAVVNGDFHITFENGIEAASGRTVFSTSFSATVQP